MAVRKQKDDTDDGMQYGAMGRAPSRVPDGRVLAHNHVRHHARMGSGTNGFRWWTWPKENVSENFTRCGCGYAGLPHVAKKGHAETYKCETKAAIAKIPEVGFGPSLQ